MVCSIINMTWEPMLPKFVLLLKSFSGISQKESYPADGTDPPHAAHAANKRRSSSGGAGFGVCIARIGKMFWAISG
jgi:hypothetical protein